MWHGLQLPENNENQKVNTVDNNKFLFFTFKKDITQDFLFIIIIIIACGSGIT